MGGSGEAQASPPAAERIDFTVERGRHRRFVGRDDVLARLDEWLLGPDDTGWVVVTGGPGMGKSALLSKWLDRREAAGAAVPHHLVRRQVIDWDQPERIAAALAVRRPGGALAGRAGRGRRMELHDKERFVHEARQLLLEEPAAWAGAEAYRPRHDWVRELMAERLGAAALRAHHETLARTLARWPSTAEPMARRYALRHALIHRVEAGAWTDTWRLAADMSFLEAKCRELGAHEAELRGSPITIAPGSSSASASTPASSSWPPTRWRPHRAGGERCDSWQRAALAVATGTPRGALLFAVGCEGLQRRLAQAGTHVSVAVRGGSAVPGRFRGIVVGYRGTSTRTRRGRPRAGWGRGSDRDYD